MCDALRAPLDAAASWFPVHVGALARLLAALSAAPGVALQRMSAPCGGEGRVRGRGGRGGGGSGEYVPQDLNEKHHSCGSCVCAREGQRSPRTSARAMKPAGKLVHSHQ